MTKTQQIDIINFCKTRKKYVTIERIANNLIAVSLYLCDRTYSPDKLDLSEEVVKEINKFDIKIPEIKEDEQFYRKWEYAAFLRNLADRLMGLIDY